MPIKHSSMRQTKESNTEPKPETLIIDDATQPQGQQERVMIDMPIPQHILSGVQSARAQEDTAPTPMTLDPDRKVRLEDLVFLGRASVDVDIGGIVFEISTMTHDENNALMKELYAFEGGADLFTIRSLTLAHAIRKINGEPMEAIEIPGEFDNLYDKKISLLSSMQKSVVEKLHEEFAKLTKSAEDEVSGEEIKN